MIAYLKVQSHYRCHSAFSRGIVFTDRKSISRILRQGSPANAEDCRFTHLAIAILNKEKVIFECDPKGMRKLFS